MMPQRIHYSAGQSSPFVPCRQGRQRCLTSSPRGTTEPLGECDHYLIKSVHVSFSRCGVTLSLTTPSKLPLQSNPIDFSLIGGDVTVDVDPPASVDERVNTKKGENAESVGRFFPLLC